MDSLADLYREFCHVHGLCREFGGFAACAWKEAGDKVDGGENFDRQDALLIHAEIWSTICSAARIKASSFAPAWSEPKSIISYVVAYKRLPQERETSSSWRRGMRVQEPDASERKHDSEWMAVARSSKRGQGRWRVKKFGECNGDAVGDVFCLTITKFREIKYFRSRVSWSWQHHRNICWVFRSTTTNPRWRSAIFGPSPFRPHTSEDRPFGRIEAKHWSRGEAKELTRGRATRWWHAARCRSVMEIGNPQQVAAGGLSAWLTRSACVFWRREWDGEKHR